MNEKTTRLQKLLRSMFDAAVAAADPKIRLPLYLPDKPAGRTIILGAGKAAASMARTIESIWNGPLEGLVITRYGHGVATDQIEVVEASHPIPDILGVRAAIRTLEIAKGTGPTDLALILLSGGGSSLLTLPSKNISLEQKQSINATLLRSGAPIKSINTVRKHLSAIKGGRLSQALFPSKVLSLLISDVPGDDPTVIASGPTLGDPTTLADAKQVLADFHIQPPESILNHLNDNRNETPKPENSIFSKCEYKIIATPAISLNSAATVAKLAGYRVISLGDNLEGEARGLGQKHAELVRRYAKTGESIAILSGGETTVTVKASGRGGPNTEYLLSLALALENTQGINAIACDTDGIDGTQDNAGAFITPDTLKQAQAIGLNAQSLLEKNDAYTLFQALGDLVISGPTLTNVNDFRAILVNPK